jgi:hypothetical protein
MLPSRGNFGGRHVNDDPLRDIGVSHLPGASGGPPPMPPPTATSSPYQRGQSTMAIVRQAYNEDPQFREDLGRMVIEDRHAWETEHLNVRVMNASIILYY